MSEIRLEFLPNVGGEAEGLSDGGIETFRENPFAAAARETGQNSRDARDDINKPVKLTFDVVPLNSKDFPSIEQYREAAELCLNKSSAASKEKETGFFRNAFKALNAENIRILRISDFNTKGVRGPCKEGTPFHTLAKTDGISEKEDVSSGGSFGIGKNATFALSDIQTVFISTLYTEESGNSQVLCMGKTQFISHRGTDGKEKRRKGYWGKPEGYMPLDSPCEIPEWLLRNEQGTSIFSICMRDNRTDWRYEMAAAILMNFFCTIERQEMEFEIDDAFIRINRGTLQELFNDNRVNEAVDELNARVVFDAAKILHTCLIDEQTVMESLEIEGLGTVRMHMLIRDGLGYTIGIIRNGMYITDNLSYFNEPFKRFPLHRDFAVIIEPTGKSESEWFKRLENPRHDSLSAERITDPELRARGQKAFEKLAKEIRSRIRALAKSQPSNTLELDELNDFFVSDETRIEDDAGMETDPRSKKPTPVSPVKPQPPTPASRRQPSPDDPPGPGPEPGPEPSPGPGPRPGPGPTPRPRKIMTPVELVSERALIPDKSNPSRRQIRFTSPVSADIVLYAEATGLTNSERLNPVSTSEGRIENSAVEMSCTAGQRTSIDVEFDAPYIGPVEISAYRVEEERQTGEMA